MIPSSRALLAVLAVAALSAGCTGYGPGPHPGDSVTLQYTLKDAHTGAVLRSDVNTTFLFGSESSGLGKAVDDALKGHRENQSIEVDLPAYSEAVSVGRNLPPIPVNQSAARTDFTTYVGEPTLGKTFQAYGIYTGVVTEADNETVTFEVVAEDGLETPVPTVGAVLVTHVTGDELVRELKPVPDATFAIQPPSPFQPTTPLGLPPGAYKVLGSNATSLLYGRSPSADPDLVGVDLHVVVAITKISRAPAAMPTSGNFGVRAGSQLSGDPRTVLGGGGAPPVGSDESH